MKAVYYPYSICKDEKTLKIMLLLFEQTIFIDNKPFPIRELANEMLLNISDELKTAYSSALDNGFISIFNSKHILKEYDFLITKSIYDDVIDDDFICTSVEHIGENSTMLDENLSPWESKEKSQILWGCDITNDRLPPSFRELFLASSGSYDESLELQKIISEKIRNTSEEDVKIDSWRFPNITFEEALSHYKQQFSRNMRGSFDLSAKTVTFYRIPLMHFLSLRINEAILAAKELNTSLVTDDSAFQRLFEVRFKRIMTADQTNHNQKISNYNLYNKDLQLRIAFDLFDEIVHDENFDKLSLQDIINFRIKNKKALSMLWNNVDKIARQVDFQNDFQNGYKIYGIVKKSLQEVKEQRQELIDAYKKLIKKLTLHSLGILVPVITTNITLGADFGTIFANSVAAQLGYLTTSGVSQVIDTANKIKKANDVCFSYLIDLNAHKSSKIVRKRLNNHFASQINIRDLDDVPISLITINDKKSQFKCYTIFTEILETSFFVKNNMNIDSLVKFLEKNCLFEPSISSNMGDAIFKVSSNLKNNFRDEL